MHHDSSDFDHPKKRTENCMRDSRAIKSVLMSFDWVSYGATTVNPV